MFEILGYLPFLVVCHIFATVIQKLRFVSVI